MNPTPKPAATRSKGRKKERARPKCPQCNHYADQERDVKGKFYVACAICSYDSRFGIQPHPFQ